MTDRTLSIKRVFFRLRSNGSDLTDIEIVNRWLSETGLPLCKNFLDPHWVYQQPQEDRVYHIVLDVNPAAADPDVKIQNIPHELYRVHFRKSRVDL